MYANSNKQGDSKNPLTSVAW